MCAPWTGQGGFAEKVKSLCPQAEAYFNVHWLLICFHNQSLQLSANARKLSLRQQ